MSGALLFLAAGIALPALCSAQHAVIEGSAAGSGDRFVEFVRDHPATGALRRTVAPDSAGRFRFDFPAETLAGGVLRYGEREALLLLGPGDSLRIEFGADTLAQPHLSGPAAPLNREIAACLSELAPHNLSPAPPAGDPASAAAYIAANADAQRRRLREYARRNESSPLLLRWGLAQIACSNALALHRLAGERQPVDRDPLWPVYDSLLPAPAQGALCPDYREAMKGYLEERYLAPAATKKLIASGRGASALTGVLNKIDKNEAAGPRRDLLGFLALSEYLLPADYDAFCEVLYTHRDRLPGPLGQCIDSLRRRGGNADRRRFTADTFERLLEESREGVIYVDIWGAWCPPCLAQMRPMRSLQQRLEGVPVRFVTICVQSKYSEWDRLMREHATGTATNYYIDQAANGQLDRYVRVSSFPRYLILAAGRIADPDAQRPSSGAIIEGTLRSLARVPER